jgi:hypothetical protein
MPIRGRFRAACYISSKCRHHRFAPAASSRVEFAQQRDPIHLVIGILAIKNKDKHEERINI